MLLDIDHISFKASTYCGRKLYLAEFHVSGEVKNRSCAFYKSAGISEPDRKNGDIFPILGILDHGKLGRDLRVLFPHEPYGWIAKNCQRDWQGLHRDNPVSYFGSENLRRIALLLEELEAFGLADKLVEKIDLADFFYRLDMLYRSSGDNLFTKSYMLKMLQKEGVKA